MWAPISLNSALRKHLNGKQVKLVDLQRDTCRNLSEVLKDFADGVMFYTDTVAAEDPDFREAVEEMTEDLPPAAPDPEQSAPKKRGKKTVDDVEREYANRKITDLKGLRALRDAGWSAKKLAEEFRCSEATVYNTLKKLEAKEETA